MTNNDFWSCWLGFLESDDGAAFLNHFDGIESFKDKNFSIEIVEAAKKNQVDTEKVCLAVCHLRISCVTRGR